MNSNSPKRVTIERRKAWLGGQFFFARFWVVVVCYSFPKPLNEVATTLLQRLKFPKLLNSFLLPTPPRRWKQSLAGGGQIFFVRFWDVAICYPFPKPFYVAPSSISTKPCFARNYELFPPPNPSQAEEAKPCRPRIGFFSLVMRL